MSPTNHAQRAMPESTPDRSWQFAIDVGGTFSDCIGRGPDGSRRVVKVLSSGRTPGRGRLEAGWLVDPARNEPDGFWVGQALRLGAEVSLVAESHPGRLRLVSPPEGPAGAAVGDDEGAGEGAGEGANESG